jgi:hypothetical protein
MIAEAINLRMANLSPEDSRAIQPSRAGCVLCGLLLIGSGQAHAVTYDINATGSLGGIVTGTVTVNDAGTSITAENVSVTEPSNPAQSTSFTSTCPSCGVAFGDSSELRIDLIANGSSTNLNLYIILATGQLDTTGLMSAYYGSSGFTDYLSGTATAEAVSATPLPAALPLYATGLGALVLLRWRRKRKAAAFSFNSRAAVGKHQGGAMSIKVGVFASVALAALETLFFAPQVQASSVLFQSVPSLTADPTGDACSSCGGGEQVYDTFTLSSNASISAITFDALTIGLNNAQVSIYTTNGALPGSSLFSQTFTGAQFASVVPGGSVGGGPATTALVTVDPSGLSLSAGTYFISFFDPSFLGVALFSAGGSGQAVQIGCGGICFEGGESLGFQIQGNTIVSATPLPAALPLFAGGLGALGAITAWRRKRKAAALAA